MDQLDASGIIAPTLKSMFYADDQKSSAIKLSPRLITVFGSIKEIWLAKYKEYLINQKTWSLGQGSSSFAAHLMCPLTFWDRSRTMWMIMLLLGASMVVDALICKQWVYWEVELEIEESQYSECNLFHSYARQRNMGQRQKFLVLKITSAQLLSLLQSKKKLLNLWPLFGQLLAELFQILFLSHWLLLIKLSILGEYMGISKIGMGRKDSIRLNYQNFMASWMKNPQTKSNYLMTKSKP